MLFLRIILINMTKLTKYYKYFPKVSHILQFYSIRDFLIFFSHTSIHIACISGQVALFLPILSFLPDLELWTLLQFPPFSPNIKANNENCFIQYLDATFFYGHGWNRLPIIFLDSQGTRFCKTSRNSFYTDYRWDSIL